MASPSQMGAVGIRPTTWTPQELNVLATNPFAWWRTSELQPDLRTMPSLVVGGGNMVANQNMVLATHAQFGTIPVYANASATFCLDSDLPASSWKFLHDNTDGGLFIHSLWLSNTTFQAFTTCDEAAPTTTVGTFGWHTAGGYSEAKVYRANASIAAIATTPQAISINTKYFYHYRLSGNHVANFGASANGTGTYSSANSARALRLLNNNAGNAAAMTVFAEAIVYKTGVQGLPGPYGDFVYNAGSPGLIWKTYFESRYGIVGWNT